MDEKKKIIIPITFDESLKKLPDEQAESRNEEGVDKEFVPWWANPNREQPYMVLSETGEMDAIELPSNVFWGGGIPDYPLGMNENNPLQVDKYQAEFALSRQLGKQKADLDADLEKRKRKERENTIHNFSGPGFARGKMFCDGTWSCKVIANGRIEKVERWLFSGCEYVRLTIMKIRTGYVGKSIQTEVFKIKRLEDEAFVKTLLSRYFEVVDDAVHKPNAVKDFRSSIYTCIDSVEPVVINERTGWYMKNRRPVFFKGGDFPIKDSLLAKIKIPEVDENVCVGQLLEDICEGMSNCDFNGRIAFLLGFGLITWLSKVCGVAPDKPMGIMLLGRENSCRRFADALLKIYKHEKGVDIIDVKTCKGQELEEHVARLADDVCVISCFRNTEKTLERSADLISSCSYHGINLDAPLAVVANLLDEDIYFDDYVVVDVNGLEISDGFIFALQKLKRYFIRMFETREINPDVIFESGILPYYEQARIVFSTICSELYAAGVAKEKVDQFLNLLKKGLQHADRYIGSEGEYLTFLFEQRMELLVKNGQLETIDIADVNTIQDLERRLLVRKESVCVLSSFFDKEILQQLHLTEGDFPRVLKALESKGLINVYADGKSYVKKLMVKGVRENIYEFDRRLFSFLGREEERKA